MPRFIFAIFLMGLLAGCGSAQDSCTFSSADFETLKGEFRSLEVKVNGAANSISAARAFMNIEPYLSSEKPKIKACLTAAYEGSDGPGPWVGINNVQVLLGSGVIASQTSLATGQSDPRTLQFLKDIVAKVDEEFNGIRF